MVDYPESCIAECGSDCCDGLLFSGRKSKGVNNPGLGTTPVLEKYLTEYLVNSFGNIKSLLSGIDTIHDKELQAFKNPTIFDMAKASGYRTILINVQGDFPDLFFRGSDMSRVDEVYLNEDEFDAQIASFVAGSKRRRGCSYSSKKWEFMCIMRSVIPEMTQKTRYSRQSCLTGNFTLWTNAAKS